jgi:hypothetical protein
MASSGNIFAVYCIASEGAEEQSLESVEWAVVAAKYRGLSAPPCKKPHGSGRDDGDWWSAMREQQIPGGNDRKKGKSEADLPPMAKDDRLSTP